MPLVQIVGDPPWPAAGSRRPLHDRKYEGAQVVASRYHKESKRRAHGLHSRRRLAVEEIELPDGGEHTANTHQRVLRHLPQLAYLLPRSRAEAHRLDYRRRGHGKHGPWQAW